MNAFIVALLAIVAIVAASDPYYGNDDHFGNTQYGRGYGYGFRRTYDGIEAVYNNAARQKGVNYLAERVGASSGTAYRYGVPGTGLYFGSPSYYRGNSYGPKSYGSQRFY